MIHFNVPGGKRKQLAADIAEWLGENVKYLGAPGFAYAIGPLVLAKDGNLQPDETMDEETFERLTEHLTDLGYECDMREEKNALRVCVSLPEALLDKEAEERLNAIVTAKGNLIRKALGQSDLTILHEDGRLCFPWLNGNATPDEIRALEAFVCALCNMAKNAKRVTAKEKEAENDKHAMRCFLLRLGFIGEKYKPIRKILLRNMVGSSAFKTAKEENGDV